MTAPAPAPPGFPVKGRDQDGATGDLVLDRANYQIAWYDRHATQARIGYYIVKGLQILLASAVPVTAATHVSKVITGTLGGAIVVLESAQQLFKYHDNWLRYRATCEAMLKEAYLYVVPAGDYASAPNPRALLAQRNEDLAASESAQWIHLQTEQVTEPPKAVAKP